MKASNSVSLKILVCAATSIALTVGFSWSFVESTAIAYGAPTHNHTLSAGAHGGAPLAPFAAALPGRSATLLS